MDIRLLNKVLVTFRDLTGVLLGHFSAFQYHTKPQTTLLDYEWMNLIHCLLQSENTYLKHKTGPKMVHILSNPSSFVPPTQLTSPLRFAE